MEWNRNYRLAGFFGDRDAAQEVVNAFPEMNVTTLHESPNRYIRMRKNVPLREGDDRLFEVAESAENSS